MKNILIIEDDEKIGKAMSLRLRSMGFNTATATDAICAMSEANRFRPDMVFMDINMPGGDGFIVADRMRASNELGDTPIVFITASKQPEHREKARACGAVDFLEKPFSTTQLMESVDNCLL